MWDWLLRLLTPPEPDVADTREIDYASFLPELSGLGWPESGIAPAKQIEASWLIDRLLRYQSTYTDPSLFHNGPALAGDLFAAGFEDDDLAWLWGESSESIEPSELTHALHKVGIGRLPDTWVVALQMIVVFRQYLDGGISLRGLSKQLSAWWYVEEVRGYWDAIYQLDHYDEMDDNRQARNFTKNLLVHLESMNEEMMERVADHLSRLATRAAP